MKITRILSSFLVIIIVISQITLAGGDNKISYFGARPVALNGLYIAGVDGVSNLYHNPAGLSYLTKRTFEASYFLRSEQNTFNGDIRGIYKTITKSEGSYNLGITWSILKNLTLGLGYMDNVNYQIDWPYVIITKQGTISIVNAFDLNQLQRSQSISPAVGYKFGPISAGITINITRLKNEYSFPQNNYNWIDSKSQPLYQFNLSEKNWLLDFNFGLMYEFNDQLRFGVTVVNGLNKTISGEAKSEMYAVVDSGKIISGYSTNYQSPWRIGFGTLYKIQDNLKLNFDVRYSLYGNLDDEIIRKFDDDLWQTKSNLPDSVTGFSVSKIKQFFNNTVDAGIGMEYNVMSDLDFNLGYRFSQTPNTKRSYDMLNPTVSTHLFSVGFVYYDNSFTISGSLIYFRGISETVKNSDFLVQNGVYNTSGVIPSLNIKYEF